MRRAGVPSAPVSCTSRYQLALGGPRGVCPINISAVPRRGSTAAGPRTQTQASGRGHPSCGSGTLPRPLGKAATATAPSTGPAALQLARTTGAAPSSTGNVPTPPQMYKSPSSRAPCPQKGSGWRQPRTGPPPWGWAVCVHGWELLPGKTPRPRGASGSMAGQDMAQGGSSAPSPLFLPPHPAGLRPRWRQGHGARSGRMDRGTKGGSLTSPLPSMGFLLALWAVGSHVHVPEVRAAKRPTTVTRPPLAPHESSTHLLEPPLCCVRGNGAVRDPARDPAPLHPPIPQHTSPMGPGPARSQLERAGGWRTHAVPCPPQGAGEISLGLSQGQTLGFSSA